MGNWEWGMGNGAPDSIPHSPFPIPSYLLLVSFSRASYYYVYYATHTGRGVGRARM
jgi:hypothetical protein